MPVSVTSEFGPGRMNGKQVQGMLREWWKRFRDRPKKPKGTFRQYAESIAWAVGVALLIRSFLFEPFQIPTGSMIPTLQIGDHIFVSKSAYGIKLPFTSDYLVRWSLPDRGDIVVFPFPVKGHHDYGKDFIKRVVGLPGDRVRLEGNRLLINGEAVATIRQPGLHDCGGNSENRPCSQCVQQKEEMGSHEFTTQHCPEGEFQYGEWPRTLPGMDPQEFVVPEDRVFVMGDNRDNSADGRFWTRDVTDQFTPQFRPNPDIQTVPVGLLKGRAVLVWWAEDKSRLFSVVD